MLVLVGFLGFWGVALGQNLDSLRVAGEVDSLLEVSKDLISKREFEKAFELNEKIEDISLSKIGCNSVQYGRACALHGSILAQSGSFVEAEKWYLKAEEIVQRAIGKENRVYCSIILDMGAAYCILGQYRKSEAFLLEGKSRLSRLFGNQDPDYIRALGSLAQNYSANMQLEESERLILEVKSFREKTIGKNNFQYCGTLVNLGIIYNQMGENNLAEKHLTEALEILKKLPYYQKHPFYGNCLITLVDVCELLGQFEKAESLLLENIKIQEKSPLEKEPLHGRCLRSLARHYFYYNSRRDSVVETLLLQSLNLLESKTGKNSWDYLNILDDLARFYISLGNIEKAEKIFLETKDISEKILGKKHLSFAKSLEGLASVYLESDQFEKAEQHYLEALKIIEKIFDANHPDHFYVLTQLTRFYIRRGDVDKSEEIILKSNEVQRDLLKKTSAYLRENELRSYLKQIDKRTAEMYSFIQSSGKILPRLVVNCYDDILFYKGFLLSVTNRTNRLAQKDPATTEQFKLLKSYHRHLAKQYSKSIAERDSATIADLETQADSIEKILVRTVAGFGQALRQVNWQEVQATLKNDQAAIEFVSYKFSNPDPTDSIMYAALVVRPGWEAPRFVPLFEEKQLAKLTEHPRSSLENFTQKLYAAPQIDGSENLYQLIFKPIENAFVGENLPQSIIFSPAGLLHRLNFDAIETETGHILAEKYSLRRLGSTRQLVVQEATSEKSNEAAIFGGIRYESDTTAIALANRANGILKHEIRRGLDDFSFENSDSNSRGGDWKFLGNTQKEAENINFQLKNAGFNTKFFSGFAATEEVFKTFGQAATSPKVIHLATHGFFFPDPKTQKIGRDEPIFKISDHPMLRSGIVFAGANSAWKTGRPPTENAEDGILTAYEVSQMNLSNTELVVLSACETGLGDITGNEGVYGLQRAFKIAGAKFLLMSLWQVPDFHTQILMKNFYKNWLERGMEIPQAFQNAQNDLRKRYQNPFFWAGFVLVE